MGLFEDFLKQKNSQNESDADENISNPKNFSYLDNLIKNGKNEIILDSDIILDDSEIDNYSNGISMGDNDLTIDGNGHIIDARGKTGIFNIYGDGNIRFNNITFKNGNNSVKGGAIISYGNVIINDCKFYGNDAGMGGGAIANMGNMELYNSLFDGNYAQKGGGAISSDQGSLDASNLIFINNKSYLGGVINNFAKLSLKDSQIKENSAEFEGGAIYNNPGGILRVTKTSFIKNTAENGIVFNRGSDVEFIDCEFSQHDITNNLIFNEDALKFIDCSFNQNNSSSIIKSTENAIDLSVLNGEFTGNTTEISAIHTLGKTCTVSKTLFKNNTSKSRSCCDIFNESELTLDSPNLEGISQTVLNRNMIKSRRMSVEDAEKCIDNQGNIEYYDIPESGGNKFNFSYLDDLIHGDSVVDLNNLNSLENVKIHIDENGDIVLSEGDKSNAISLTTDITLDNYEVDFYEGGIEIDIDNLIIDGNNHLIDAKGYSRIFIISGKNITLKNIIFRNGNLINKFEEHTTGGGAIRTLNGSSLILENCRFVDNYSDDDGGAILNNGLIHSKNSQFENNNSKYFGGAIYNRSEYTTSNDSFVNNSSDRAGAIYNIHKLNINNIEVSGNSSKFSQPLYSSYFVKTVNISQNINELLYNTGNIDQMENSIETFTFLKDKIVASNSISLKQDIIFNYDNDSDIKQGFVIDKGGEVIIDGNDHMIDGGGEASLFKINNTKIIFRNITFNGLYCESGSVIESDSEMVFENCKFLNNKSVNESSLIISQDGLKLENSLFSDNSSNNKSLIVSGGKFNILNAQFINNSSNSDGGLIHNGGKLTIKDSNFEGNSSKANGGVINNFVEGLLEIIKSDFVNNSSSVEGGAIMNLGILNVENSRFKGNNAGNAGGVIHNVNTAVIQDSFFAKNEASFAGAISNMINLTLKNVVFEENTSRRDGAVLNNQGDIKVEDCIFRNNNAGNYGGVMGNMKNIEIKNSIFEGNSAVENAGVINNGTPMSVLKVEDCEFTNNSASYGGVVSNYGGRVELTDSSFSSNSSKKMGGVLISSNISQINNCNFISNSSPVGGVIFNVGKIMLNHSTFTDNNSQHGRDVANPSHSILEGSDNAFINNASKGKDGSIFGDGVVNLKNSTFN